MLRAAFLHAGRVGGSTVHRVQRIDEDNISPETRRLYLRASIITLVANLALVAAKGAAAAASGSSAVFADAANSAADVAYSLFLGVALWLSLRPPDLGHPHGHRRIEPLVSVAIGLAMGIAGIQAALTGWQTLSSGPEAITSVWAYIAPVGTIVAKYGMYVTVRNIGVEAHSPAIKASAKDNLMTSSRRRRRCSASRPAASSPSPTPWRPLPWRSGFCAAPTRCSARACDSSSAGRRPRSLLRR